MIKKINLYLKRIINYVHTLFYITYTIYKIKEKINEIENKINFIEKIIIFKSNLFDCKYYNTKYNHEFSKHEAINFWHTNWINTQESPSHFINMEYCVHKYKSINPILSYISQGAEKYFNTNNKNSLKSRNIYTLINSYIENKKTRKANKCVYTCITNNYDDIYEIESYNIIDNNIDYILFTDNKEHIQQKYIGIWEVKPLFYSCNCHTKNNRWHKLHPHILFPEYKESIYIDANINIISDFIYNIDSTGKIILVPEHFKNVCIYKEFSDVIKSQLDNISIVSQQLSFITKDRMPINYGFTENNIIYRKHHNKQIIKIMNEWWSIIYKYSKRDQLSFTYTLWKNNILINDITFTNPRFLIYDFYFWDHKKPRGI